MRSFIFIHLKIHRPLQASLFELRPDKPLEPQRTLRINIVSFVVERTTNEKPQSLCDLGWI